MSQEKCLDDLIEAGWHVIDSEFDRAAVVFWKRRACEFLVEFLGPDHASTQSFLVCLRHSEAALLSKT
jgi:hypothetical protein